MGRGIRSMTAKVGIILQARMGSSRFRGKVLRPILGKPMLQRQIERIQDIDVPFDLIVATTDQPQDDVIADFCRRSSLDCYRGSERDVLARFYEAAQRLKTDLLCRMTADCPLSDPRVMEAVIAGFERCRPGAVYGSNTNPKTYPVGINCEVFTRDALRKSYLEAVDARAREHVTWHMRRHPAEYPAFNLRLSEDYSHYRLTVDEPCDYELVNQIYEALYPRNAIFGWRDCVRLMESDPRLRSLNAHVKQKRD